jgi:hypothetical protein
MTTPDPEPADDSTVTDSEGLPPEHPAGADTPVSAGEAVSNEGLGGQLAPTQGGRDEQPAVDRAPDRTS